MTVIARTTEDATFNLKQMQNTLIDLGQQYGHTWDVVANISKEWVKAGYNIADALELTETSMLALNVADMNVQQSTQGLIAIMSQWDLQASDLVEVIDKLNVTSDRFAITTGDLVDAVLRSSGAARAANISFDDLVGMITATRVASGRAGGEIGNAMNTILSYITRQSTLTKLAEAGIATFADAANTKLRPAIDIMSDITDKWLDNAEDMPETLIDIADSMGLFGEELADAVGMQEQWNDLQKIEVEQSVAGVRRRQFLIGLMRNFNMVQSVTNQLVDVEGYSMAQNIRTMKTLEKQYAQLQMELTKLAQAIGEAGLMAQLKAVVRLGKDVIGVFANLDSGLQTFILTLGELAIGIGIIKSLAGMMGGGAILSGIAGGAGGIAAALSAGALAGPAGVLTLGLIGTQALNVRKLREEYEEYLEVTSNVVKRQEQLNKIIDISVKDSISYNTAIDEMRELNNAVAEQYPQLIDGYDKANNMLLLNADMLEKVKEEQEALTESGKDYISVTKRMVDSLPDYIKDKEKEAETYENNARKVKDLARQREHLAKVMSDESVVSDERYNAMKQEEDARRIIMDIVGEEAAQRIEAANWHIDAVNKEIEGINSLAQTSRESARERIRDAKDQTKIVLEATKARIEAALAEEAVLGKYKETPKWVKGLPLFAQDLYGALRTDYYIVGDFLDTIFGYDVPTLSERAELEKKQHVADLQKLVGDLTDQLKEYDSQLVDTLPSIDHLGKYLANTKDKAKKLTDILGKYIETAMRAADVQGMLNNETQRTIDGYRAKIDYLTRDNASSWERAEALRLEADLTEKLREKQEGVHQEANFLREALAKLEQYQKGVNTETEEGWEAYKKLESQIESIKGTIEKLGIEWFNLAKAQEETIVQTKIMQDALKDLDFYARLGIKTVEEQLAKTRSIYSEISSIRALTVAEDYDMIQRQHSIYKQMLLDMKRDAEDAYKERIKLIEKETEATIEHYRKRIEILEEETKRAIALIQMQIDALDEEDTLDRREEERNKHEEKMDELLDKRRYHELRTGREHSQAILDIDKQLAEEQRKWEQRQSEWAREDRRRDLQQQIEDIRGNAEEQKSIYNEQIEDVRKRANEQKEMWQEVYERMQRDFSDHSVSMIALAATFDPGFWEDAKRKGELWVKGFKDGTAGFGDYLYDLTPQASSIVEGARSERDATYRHVDEEPTPEAKFPSSYTIEEWGHTYTVADGGHNIYKNGRWIPAEDFKYLPNSVLQLARDMKAGKAHTGAMTASAGIAELIPGEMIFPPNLSAQLEKLIGVLTARPLSPSMAQEQWRSGSSGSRVNVAGNLLNVEKAMFEDETDMEIFAREINRQLANLGN